MVANREYLGGNGFRSNSLESPRAASSTSATAGREGASASTPTFLRLTHRSRDSVAPSCLLVQVLADEMFGKRDEGEKRRQRQRWRGGGGKETSSSSYKFPSTRRWGSCGGCCRSRVGQAEVDFAPEVIYTDSMEPFGPETPLLPSPKLCIVFLHRAQDLSSDRVHPRRRAPDAAGPGAVRVLLLPGEQFRHFSISALFTQFIHIHCSYLLSTVQNSRVDKVWYGKIGSGRKSKSLQ